jgi:hypothetical protein
MGSRRSCPNSQHARMACSERKRCCDGVGASQPVADSWTSAVWAISLGNGDGRRGRASHTWVGSWAKYRSSLASLSCVCCFLFRREGDLVVLHDWAGVDALESADLQIVIPARERHTHASVELRPTHGWRIPLVLKKGLALLQITIETTHFERPSGIGMLTEARQTSPSSEVMRLSVVSMLTESFYHDLV